VLIDSNPEAVQVMRARLDADRDVAKTRPAAPARE
jgi:hypothetical protein